MNRNGNAKGIVLEISLEDLLRGMAVEQEAMQLPEDLVFGGCARCRQWVHPANNLYLLSDLVEGSTTNYVNGSARYFVPVTVQGIVLCNGEPDFYQLLEGNRLVSHIARGVKIQESRKAWTAAFQKAIDYAMNGEECFQFSLKKGLWRQEYSCRMFIKGMGGLHK